MPPDDEDRRRCQNSSQRRDILIDQSPLVNISGALSTSRGSHEYARAHSSLRRIFLLAKRRSLFGIEEAGWAMTLEPVRSTTTGNTSDQESHTEINRAI